MALENPIGNPLEPQNRPQFITEYNTLGPVDDSMIGGTATSSSIGVGTDFGSPLGPVADDADSGRRHLSLVPNDFDDLFDAVEEQWQDRALCAQTDPEAFFPEKGGSTREAKRICQGCEVKSECLEYALHNDERFGIWGGLSERERRRLKRGII
jgi:WhiB family redox-sensing transcriptional regulator